MTEPNTTSINLTKTVQSYWLPVVVYAVLIFALSSIPQEEMPKNILYPDYLLHMLEYLPFGFLLFRALKRTTKSLVPRQLFLVGCGIVFLYALSDEFHQFFVAGRDASFVDVASDMIGAAIGMKLVKQAQ